MKYELSIRQQNIQPHLDIEQELQNKRNGLFTFILRINSGNIVDFAVIENVDTKPYAQTIIIEKWSISHGVRERSQQDALRPNNIQCGGQERVSSDDDLEHREE